MRARLRGRPRPAFALLALLAGAGCSRGGTEARVPVVTVRSQRLSRVVEADGHLKSVRTTPVTVPPEVDGPLRIIALLPDGQLVKEGEVVARLDDLELRERLSAARAELATAAARREKEAALLGAAGRDRLRVAAAAERELALTRDFQRKDPLLYSRDQIIESEIDGRLQAARAEHARGSEQMDRRLGQRRLGLIDVDARKAEEGIRRSERGLAALQIRAPHDGVVILRRGWSGEPIRTGDTVFRSMSIAEVARLDQLEAEVFVLEAEAAGLAMGRRAEVIIEARPGAPFPATVQQVEAVAKRRNGKSPTQYFGVTLALSRTAPELMKPGQRARARLFLEEQQALVVPRPAVFDRDGRWVAYRRDAGGAFAPVEVKLGSATAGLLSVSAGLREGDVIALRDPDKDPGEALPAPAAQAAGK